MQINSLKAFFILGRNYDPPKTSYKYVTAVKKNLKMEYRKTIWGYLGLA